MGIYLTEMKLTKQGIKGMAEAKDDRRETIGKLMEGLGGKLLGYYFAVGDADLILIGEAPSHDAYSSALLSSIMAGTIEDTKTTVLMSYEEGISAMKKASSVGYTPPGN